MKGDLKKLQGTWNMMTLEMEGQKYPTGGSKIVITGERFVSLNMGAQYEGGVSVDESQTPKTFDLLFDMGPEKGNKSLGIYELDGNDWKICLGLTGKSRPKAFTTKKGTGHALETLQRESAADRAAAKKKPAIDENAPGVAELDGEWFMLSCMQDGKPINAQFLKFARRVFKGNGTTLFAGKQVFMKSSYSADAGQIDYHDLRQHGIYEVRDGKLNTALAATSAPRPTDFTAAKGDGRTVSAWSRKK
jgi:uncharacterized protein (TIGR03067 family)